MITEKTIPTYTKASEYQKKHSVQDNIDPTWCTNVGPPAFSIEFPTPQGKKLLVAQNLRKCHANKNWNCNSEAYSNPIAFKNCPDNKFSGDESIL